MIDKIDMIIAIVLSCLGNSLFYTNSTMPQRKKLIAIVLSCLGNSLFYTNSTMPQRKKLYYV
ncbi:hypothetical protein DW004_13380 [Firmicutes bacterium AF36-3BH]|nr:hypothetical protein DW004_13380 [Firmicutes bacterium AF36-3BH]